MQGKNDEVTYVFEPACQLGAKLAGVHWWFKSRAHAAELTAGYYNTRERDGYIPLMDVLKRYHTHLSFTCVEMRDCEHPPEGRCSPQGEPLVLASPFPPCVLAEAEWGAYFNCAHLKLQLMAATICVLVLLQSLYLLQHCVVFFSTLMLLRAAGCSAFVPLLANLCLDVEL